jgi:hypothetical protein
MSTAKAELRRPTGVGCSALLGDIFTAENITSNCRPNNCTKQNATNNQATPTPRLRLQHTLKRIHQQQTGEIDAEPRNGKPSVVPRIAKSEQRDIDCYDEHKCQNSEFGVVCFRKRNVA